MKISKPSHSTVVAYLALFVALGGTTIAAQGRLGASDLEKIKIRKAKTEVGATSESTPATAVARCKDNERIISGGGAWTFQGPTNPPPTLSRSQPSQFRSDNSYIVTGVNPPGVPNTLLSIAYCLPK